ncbi:LysR substrate-binding domain-containing protein [Paracoccus onubensis]|uniref:LysR substrate-binding domain-containing protein n=1 Tax=Paracoccus onubensis TaxID=1675788 RepID=UPI00273007B9|nr:LysR substrate-binding domain-containing protein [Paracoccus onubensis]MDP0929515.1 LysR substrate-binding domain-containing protein [Paracoccus onubensis]
MTQPSANMTYDTKNSIRHLPLANLRSFEAAARCGSFTKAAAELHLSDSAISHQISRLESALGFALFEKAGRGIRLTDTGRSFAAAVTGALQEIYGTALRLSERPEEEGGRLKLTCPPMFASGWLSRNIAEFCNDHPQIECHVRLAENQTITKLPDADIGILFGAGAWPDLHAILLEDILIGPVCSPVLMSGAANGLRSPKDLQRVFLLHWDNGSEWRRWLAQAGQMDIGLFTRNLYCNDLGAAIELAVHGAGCALASETLTGMNIRDGSLIRPFVDTINPNGGWYAVVSPENLARPRVRMFLYWLLSKFGQSLAGRFSE